MSSKSITVNLVWTIFHHKIFKKIIPIWRMGLFMTILVCDDIQKIDRFGLNFSQASYQGPPSLLAQYIKRQPFVLHKVSFSITTPTSAGIQKIGVRDPNSIKLMSTSNYYYRSMKIRLFVGKVIWQVIQEIFFI